jgi:hypothetical protein
MWELHLSYVEKVTLSMCLINGNIRGREGGISYRWVVSFTPRPLNPQGKSPRYPLDRRLIGPQNLPRRCGVDINLLPLAENRALAIQPVALRCADWAVGNKLLKIFVGKTGEWKETINEELHTTMEK